MTTRGILEGKRILVAGVTMDSSIGFATAKVAQEQGATVLISNFGRALGITRRIAKRLPTEPPVLELDVTDETTSPGSPTRCASTSTGSTASCTRSPTATRRRCSAASSSTGPWPDVAQAVQVSAYSLMSLTQACRPLMSSGGSVVGLTFDATVAWPAYDWMGVAKAGAGVVLALPRPRPRPARHPGQPGLRRPAQDAGRQGDPRASRSSSRCGATRAPLGWDNTDQEPTAKAVCALLSDLFPATTGEIVHVDGGLHAMGA